MEINTQSEHVNSPSVFRWVLILGATGFVAGFLGPMIFAPEANQGPLVGIFISGPGGVALGALLCVVSRVLQLSAKSQWRTLWVFSAALALVTLYSIMPGPQLRGYVLDVEVQNCEPPAQAADDAIRYWEKRVAQVTWASPRRGWQDDSRQRLQYDQGVVLDVVVNRKMAILEERKPWNKGRIVASSWQAKTDSGGTHAPFEPPNAIVGPTAILRSYYAQYAGHSCGDYPIGAKSLQFAAYDLSGLTRGAEDWPPRKLADFLDRQTLEQIPSEFRKLVVE